jgi:hypothetical protein
MGGLGSGRGPKVGAGRKPGMAVVGGVDVLPVVPVIDPGQVPEGFSPEQEAVWRELAPHAVRRQTLVQSTLLGFRQLCRLVVIERTIAADPDQVGGANHRGVLQRIDAELLRFDLAPNGKPHGDATGGVARKPSNLERLKERRQTLHAIG